MTPFDEVLTEAVQDFTEHGYDDSGRLELWLRRLRKAAELDLPPKEVIQKRMAQAMELFYRRGLSFTAVKQHHPDASRFTVDRIRPQLRPELTKRIRASADLIRLNREQAIDKTLQRFSGWASSVPDGGSRVVDKREVKSDVKKSLRQVNFEERRVAIDQGHKLVASINAVIAMETDAIAGMWRSHWRQAGYDYRPDHKERDQKIYAVRGSWAAEKGLVNKGAGYIDEMTAPAEEPFCRCYFVYLTNLRDIPDSMLTAKGRQLMEETRIKTA